MSTEKTGAMIARAAGLVLIIIGASSLLNLVSWLDVPGPAASGWTSYSPLATTTPTQDLMTQLHDTYYIVSGTASFYLPSVAQAMGGILMVFMSKPIGRWLAKGLSEIDADDAKANPPEP